MADEQWVFDYVMQILQAPTFEVPVQSWIDENCAVFDNGDNGFSLNHTEVHEEFKELVEGLINSHLAQVAITPDEFYEACENAVNNVTDQSDYAMKIVEQLSAAEDFLIFRAIMVKRNKELEMEALEQLGDFSDDEDDDGELSSALRDSHLESKEADILRRQEEQDLEDALELSEETERMKQLSLLEKEQADLEAAIAISLAMEEERLRLESEKGGESKFDDAAEGKSEGKEGKNGDLSRRGSKLPPLGNRAASLDVQRENFEENKAAVNRVLQHNSSTLGKGDYDEADIARRKRHLEAQRKRLLEKKNKERQALLKEYEEQKREVEKEPSSPKSPKSPQTKISTQQSHLTYALGRRLKQDILENGASSDMGGLDAKLKQMEAIRKQREQLLRGGFN